MNQGQRQCSTSIAGRHESALHARLEASGLGESNPLDTLRAVEEFCTGAQVAHAAAALAWDRGGIWECAGVPRVCELLGAVRDRMPPHQGCRVRPLPACLLQQRHSSQWSSRAFRRRWSPCG